jgi:glycine oxidase
MGKKITGTPPSETLLKLHNPLMIILIYQSANHTPDVKLTMIAIVGGGIIGLSIGWYLSTRGEKTVVFDRAEAGKAATWASAGMLAPNLEAEPSEEKLLPLLLESMRMWEGFAKKLEEASSMNVNYRREGTLQLALTWDDVERLRFQLNFQKSLGLDVKMIDGNTVLELEPNVNRNVLAALYSGSDHQVDNRRVAQALKVAYTGSGGVLRERNAVDKVVVEDGRVRGVSVNGMLEPADQVVVAAGAWSRELGGIPDRLKPPVRPVKGQMLSLKMDPANPLINHVTWGPMRNWGPVYMVPRVEGRLIVGTTVEEMGFDTTVTAGGLMNILRGCWELLPPVVDLPLEEVWAGLRPGSRDDAPILGPTPIEGLIMATGHFRNGILLAPITAEVIANFILSGELPDIAKPFTIERFIEGGLGAGVNDYRERC